MKSDLKSFCQSVAFKLKRIIENISIASFHYLELNSKIFRNVHFYRSFAHLMHTDAYSQPRPPTTRLLVFDNDKKIYCATTICSQLNSFFNSPVYFFSMRVVWLNNLVHLFPLALSYFRKRTRKTYLMI